MSNEKVIIRNKPADHIAYVVASTIMDSVHASEMVDWHRVSLRRLYISSTDKMEADILIERGWDTQVEFELESNPNESVDRLTDYMFNNVKQVVRDLCEEEFGVEFDDREKIRTLRINTEVGEYTDVGDEKYVVEFDTETFDSDVITDHKMSGNSRICGRRLLVSWVWNNHVRKGLDVEALVEEFDGTITEQEVRSAISFAESSDEFDTREEIESESSDMTGETATIEELEEALSEEDDERPDVEDNR